MKSPLKRYPTSVDEGDEANDEDDGNGFML